jgi:hypothetical protein
MTAQLESPPIPASLQMASDVERRLREQQVGIFFVMPRVVRRVLQNELDIASPLQQPPHRKSCVIQRDRLLWLVARDELGVKPNQDLPDQIILIAQPEEHQLETMSREELQRHYWRLMFHARIDFELLGRTSPNRMSQAELRHRIDRIGQTSFDEIRSVLRAEQMLMRPEDDRNVYGEFIAVYHELRAFSPDLVPIYFPSLPEPDRVLAVIGEECDASVLLEETRPIDLPREISAQTKVTGSTIPFIPVSPETTAKSGRSMWSYASLVRKAEKLSARQNHVRAALVRQKALEVAPEGLIDEARSLLQEEIQKLVGRLQAALEMSDEAARPWLMMCERLLPAAQQGFWNANARLLYDLQTVCFDHEHEIYKVDLLGCVLSFGKSPLKRPLPNQRVVMMSKHLRSATLRVPSVQIDPDGRQELSKLLHEAADAAEHILRVRVEPIINDALVSAGLVPASIVERVALKKMVHELADGIVDRGFITLGSLRDAISGNQLKMPDLNDATEFLLGDPLLRADKLMSVSLDGVYQRGPFYLRWLQKANSLAYGIPWGRWLTRYIALPFGLAFLLLMFVEEMAHLVVRHADSPAAPAVSPEDAVPVDEVGSTASDIMAAEPVESVIPPHVAVPHAYIVYSHRNMFILGCVLFVLIHFPRIRQGIVWLLKTVWSFLTIVLFEIPRTVLRWKWVDRLLKSVPMMVLRRFVLAPAIATIVFWLLLPGLGIYGMLNRWWGLAIFVVSFFVLNSRVGRDTEELARELFARTWYRIRVHLVMGLFTLIVDVFRAFMDGLERVLYAVDEWLRFRSGESNLTLAIKAIVGLIWSFVHGVIRFCVTLLLEPQINPIKHFPVVTVSHKILFATFYIPLSQSLERLFELRNTTAFTIGGLILMGIPGVFGFLAWELKENWRLYKANRSPKLSPVRIGDHGETLLRLLCPGFHSGTIPRLFAKQRRVARQHVETPKVNKQAKFVERLHHEANALQRFAERDLLALLRESRTFGHCQFKVSHVELATNRVLISIEEASHAGQPMQLEFAEQSSWLVATIRESGWLNEISPDDAEIFKAAVTGFYKLASVDLVREQIERHLLVKKPSRTETRVIRSHPYDISSAGLIVWPHSDYEHEVTYALDDQPTTTPRPRSLARSAGLTAVPMSTIVFKLHDLDWNDWRKFWDDEQTQATNSAAKFAFKW